jgi:benzoyl-CoA reductase/2-hydroxyglutaryl-CoA dehydratase subunit BcrC/BadD/HgdB
MRNEYAGVIKNLYNSFAREWKESGKKIIGYTCSYVPEEVFHAAGMLPFRLGGMDATAHDISDTYFGPFICSMPKNILQLVGEGRYKFLDGMIVTPACDSMRRIDECWRKANKDIGGILPSFFFHYSVPHKISDYSLKWLEDETGRLIKELENHFDVKISAESLRNSIRVYNKGRMLLNSIDELRYNENVPLSGADALAIVLAGRAMPREIYNGILEETVKEFKECKTPITGRKRIMLVGSANDDVNLVKLIEDEGAVVVSDTVCFGSRFYRDLVDENKEPVSALAHRYLNHESCPRMIGKYQERLNIVKQKAEKARVDGVILQNIRFCDLHGSENSIYERDLEAIGIPCLKIEREYGPLSDSGRISLRVNAFLEMLDKRKEMI